MKTLDTKEDKINKILDVSFMLFTQHGYEGTSIQKIIDTLQIAKGTFYHYFKSKEELLDALSEKLSSQIEVIISSIVESDDSAVNKINRLSAAITGYKIEKKKFLLKLAEFYFKDENVLLFHKINEKSKRIMLPYFTRIIKDGINEGTFSTDFPEETARHFILLINDTKKIITEILLYEKKNEDTVRRITNEINSFHYHLDRILGVEDSGINFYPLEDVLKFFKTDINNRTGAENEY